MKICNLLSAVAIILFGSIATAQVQPGGSLVFVVDVSGSIDDKQMVLQMEGYSKALEFFPYLSDVYVETIVFESQSNVVASGHVDLSKKFFSTFTMDVWSPDGAPRNDMRPNYGRGDTCLYKALQYIYDNFEKYPKPVVIDISLDGEDNCDPVMARSLSHALYNLGAEINTVFIGDHNVRSEEFVNNITHGKKFEAKTFFELEDTLYQKIQMEISFLIDK